MPLFPLKIRRIFFPIRIWKILFLISLTFYLLPFSLSFLFLSCEKSTAPLNNPQVFLTAEYVGVTEADILMKIKNIEENTQYRLYRNDSMINSGTFVQTETIFTDTSLLPAHNYIYKAQLIRNEQLVANSQPLVITTMDTTSHNYMWTIDTIGGIGSFLYDVFAISENDVWAVGDIDTGAYPTFNAMHWDGLQWELIRIKTNACGGVDYPPIRAIFAFSSNDILFAHIDGSITYYDGNNFTNDCSLISQLNGSINKMWGTNSNNIFIVGGSGTIVHYDGSSWQRMESGTQLRLTDIWGFPNRYIYIVGSSSSTLDNVFLVFKDNLLQQRVDDSIWRKKSVWGTAFDRLYIAGSGLFYYDGNELISLPWPSNLPFIHVENLRGSEENNIFMVGHFGFVAHYNGSTWHYFSEITRDITLQSVAVLENEVFAVGYDSFFGYLYRGMRTD
jgi:hypothetical protein